MFGSCSCPGIQLQVCLRRQESTLAPDAVRDTSRCGHPEVRIFASMDIERRWSHGVESDRGKYEVGMGKNEVGMGKYELMEAST